MTRSPSGAYRSAKGLSSVAVTIYLGRAAFEAMCVLSALMQLGLLVNALAGHRPTMEVARANDVRQAVLTILRLPVLLSSSILFFVWLYRAYANVGHLRSWGSAYTPGWAVGWFFVPIFSFFRPFQVVREMWNASRPEWNESDSLWWMRTRGWGSGVHGSGAGLSAAGREPKRSASASSATRAITAGPIPIA